MQDLSLMCVVDGVGDRLYILYGPGWRQRPLPNEIGEVLTLDVFHYEEMLALVLFHIVHGHNIGVRQVSRPLRLFVDSLDIRSCAASDRFDGNYFVQALLAALVDDAHASAPNFFERVVVITEARRDITCG